MGVKRPTAETYEKYLYKFFLKDIPTLQCAKAGKPSYEHVSKNAPKYQCQYTDFDRHLF